MAEEKKTCFIIMPITTPEAFLDRYRDGAAHFRHVLECLFMPSVEQAGYDPIPTIAKGADLIHAEIIKNLENSDLVLCDMSCLNPNVFFEFGIRTSLNKPVCAVKDELITNVPFDTGILHHHEYASSLEPWELSRQVAKLAEHLGVSDKRSQGKNTLWKYFGLKSEIKPLEGETGADAKLDYLVDQVEGLRRKIDRIDYGDSARRTADWVATDDHERAFEEAVGYSPKEVTFESWVPEGVNEISIFYSGTLSDTWARRIDQFVRKRHGISVRFHGPIERP
ncbi:MAG: hypothetical protein PVI86_16775 [Phycisphaerae bacterium]|jgi:hypothetical protein